MPFSTELSVWGRMLEELRERGYGQAQLCREVSKTERTVYNWRVGRTEPSYSESCVVLSIYRTLVGSTDKKYLSDLM